MHELRCVLHLCRSEKSICASVQQYMNYNVKYHQYTFRW